MIGLVGMGSVIDDSLKERAFLKAEGSLFSIGLGLMIFS